MVGTSLPGNGHGAGRRGTSVESLSFGCTESPLLHVGFLWLSEQGQAGTGRGYSPGVVLGPLWWLLLLQSMGSRACGLQ